MMRSTLLATTSVSLVGIAVVAIAGTAFAQDVPVVYRTDPGPAHPRYAQKGLQEDVAIKVSASEPLVIGSAAPQAERSVLGASQKTISTSASSSTYIMVESGDTVYALARRYGVSPQSIIDANDLRAPYRLGIGDTLVLPSPAGTGPEQSSALAAARVEIASAPANNRMITYRVREGDTLYSLSRQFGMSVTELAASNDLRAPYNLSIDQTLRISAPAPRPQPPMEERLIEEIEVPQLERTPATREPILVDRRAGSRFSWPLSGEVISEFGTMVNGVRNDGINIAAPNGAPIRAAADGEVVYTGEDLEGLGRLLLIRHDNGWVSAYAHAERIIVEKNDRVSQGQVVAKVGSSGSVKQPQLHFELRHELRPRDPLAALNGLDREARAMIN